MPDSVSSTDLHGLDAHALAAALETGALAPPDLVEACLARIEAQAHLGAFAEVYAEEARAAARAADTAIRAGYRLGPLHGVPIVIKDLVHWRDRVTACGSLALAGRRSTRTAAVVERVIAAGMIVLGKTTTVEFAFGGWGTNARLGTPWNPCDRFVHRVPGGSSSGTGVAVAAGLAPWGIGTDTGGSVRLPASFCGIVGLKTTDGRIPTTGVAPLSPSLDTIGPMTRSVADAVLLDRVLAGAPLPPAPAGRLAQTIVSDLERGVRGLRLAAMPDAEREGVAPAVLEDYDRMLAALAAAGAEIVARPLPFRFVEMLERLGTIGAAEAYAAWGVLAEDADQPLDPLVRARILAGRETGAQAYIAALAGRAPMRAAFLAALDGCDALLTPTTETTALPVAGLDESVPAARFTRFANYLGLCALALPMGADAGGLPTSLQIAAAPHGEALACQIGRAVEALRDG